MKINELGLIHIQDLMVNHFGYDLNIEVKEPMIQNRINNMCRRNENYTKEGLINKINNQTLNKNEKKDIIESILTHETYFFREESHIRSMVEHMAETKQSTVDFVSMGCSSGQEMYSVIMYVKEKLPHYFDTFNAYGTDVSEKIMKKTQAGIYSIEEINRTPNRHRNTVLKYIRYSHNNKGDFFIVDDIIKSRVKKLKYQILKDYTDNRKYDYIFCKNVLIYFKQSIREIVIDKIVNQSMKSGSLLFLGMCEATTHPQLRKINNNGHFFYEKL